MDTSVGCAGAGDEYGQPFWMASALGRTSEPPAPHVVGQERAMSALEQAFGRHRDRLRALRTGTAESSVLPRVNVGLIGPEGCGKKRLVTAVAAALKMPLAPVDLMPIRPGTGEFEGALLEALLKAAAGDSERAGQTVVLLEGIEEAGPQLQWEVAAFIRRSPDIRYARGGAPAKIPCRNLLFVLPVAGELQPSEDGVQVWSSTPIVRQLAELFQCVLSLRRLSTDDVYAILSTCDDAPLQRLARVMKARGIVLEMTELALRDVARLAEEMSPGSPLRALELVALRLESVVERAAERRHGDLFPVRIRVSEAVVAGAGDPEVEFGLRDVAEPTAVRSEGDGPSIVVPERPKRPAGEHAGARNRLASEQDLRGKAIEITPPLLDDATRLRGTVLLLECAADDGSLAPVRQDLFLPWVTRNRHVLVSGKTGCGKTTRVILPLVEEDIRDRSKSVIVVDAKGDLTPYVVEMARRHRGRRARIHYINFGDPKRSLAWNPLHGLKSRREVDSLAQCIGNALPPTRSDGYFRATAIRLLAQLISAVVTADPANASIGDVRRLLDSGLGGISRFAAEHGATELGAQVSSIESNQNAQTTMFEAINALQPWSDENVRATTSRHEFRFNCLAEEPCVVILAFAEEDTDRLLVATSLFANSLFDWALRTSRARRGQRLPRPVSLFIDEFASAVGRLPAFERRLHTLRSRGFSFTAAVQTLSQVHDVYESAASTMLAGFNTHLFMSPLDAADAEYASRLSGRMRAEVLETDAEGHRIVRRRVEERPVLTAWEIANPPVDPVLGTPVTVMLPDLPPFQAYLPPIYEQPSWAEFSPGDGPEPIRPRKAPLPLEAGGAGLGPESGFSQTAGWSKERIRERTEEVMLKLKWAKTPGSARKWWEAFVAENERRPGLVLRLGEELLARRSSVDEFFLAYVYSNCDNIQGVLHYHDYLRLKKGEEKKRREKAKGSAPAPETDTAAKTDDSLVDPFDDEG